MSGTYLDTKKMDREISQCEISVIKALRSSLRVKTLVNALNSSGCPFVPDRHIACAPCDQALSGGYDDTHNQVIICSNTCKSDSKVEEILSHELVHMFDYCTKKVTFDRIDHLACSEIRAASLASCAKVNWNYWSFEHCVKAKAAHSVAVIKNCDRKEAKKHVDKVFDKCYNDLEPIGHRGPM